MATLTLTIDDADAPEVYAALCGRESLVPANGPNARTAVLRIIKRIVREYRMANAQATTGAQPDPLVA